MQTHTKCEEKNGGEKVDDDGDGTIASTNNLGLVCVSRHVEASTSSLYGTAD